MQTFIGLRASLGIASPNPSLTLLAEAFRGALYFVEQTSSNRREQTDQILNYQRASLPTIFSYRFLSTPKSQWG